MLEEIPRYPRPLNRPAMFGFMRADDFFMIVIVSGIVWLLGSLILGIIISASLLRVSLLFRKSPYGDVSTRLYYWFLAGRKTFAGLLFSDAREVAG